MQFMIVVQCDQLIEEHQRFMFTLVHKKNFAVQENIHKFREELMRFNHFSSVLAHHNFEYASYKSIRALRDVQRWSRRLCEIVDRKIEYALDNQWQKSSTSITS